jgi:hypothetical protein
VIGVESLPDAEEGTIKFLPDDPEWVKKEPHHKVDGTEILTSGEHPLSVIQALLQELSPGQMILLSTHFHPQPMIEAMNNAGVTIYSRKDAQDDNLYLTFIQQ